MITNKRRLQRAVVSCTMNNTFMSQADDEATVDDIEKRAEAE